MDGSGEWTLDELTELVSAALSVDYDGAPTGRVRDVPDRRAIRWYVTRGLVDRPAGWRGRTALYGQRHLLQLVAIKRRQASGQSLSQIQAELAGATNQALAAVARLSGQLPDQLPAAPAVAPATARPAAPSQDRARFWADRPDRATAGTPGGRPTPLPEPDHGQYPAEPPVFTVRGIRLAPGVTLLLEQPGAVDPTAVLAAARPLLDLLAAGGPACEEEL